MYPRMYSAITLLVGMGVAVLALATAEECRDNPLLEKECHTMRKSFGEKICKTTYFSIRNLMHKNCRATCGLCSQSGRALAPPIPCHRSMYGCCWDRITAAHDRAGKGCPPCHNRHKAICKMFRWMCAREKVNADYIKMNCPVTCGFCIAKTNEVLGFSIYDIYKTSILKLRKQKRKNKQRKRKNKQRKRFFH